MSNERSGNSDDGGWSPGEMEEFLNSTFEREFGDNDAAASEIPRVKLQVSNSAFGRRIHEFEIINFGYKDIEQFLLSAFVLYQSQIVEALTQFKTIKTISYFNAEFERGFVNDDQHNDPKFEKRLIYIPSIVKEIYDETTNLREHFQSDIISHTLRKVDEAMVEGSGFTLSKIIKLIVQIFKYEPLRGSSFIELPSGLKNKRSIINLENKNDNECFKWAILAALHSDEVRARNKNKVNDVESYLLWKNELNFDGIDFPVRLNQIEKFMQQNEGLAVNVYYFDSEKSRICPLFLALKPVEYRYVNLLYLTKSIEGCEDEDEEETNINSHYCWIKNLGALVHPQTTKNNRRIFMCNRCLNHFCSHKKLEQHGILCSSMNDYAIDMPNPREKYVIFKNHKNEIKVPFIIYADTEALLKEPDTEVFGIDCKTRAQHQHEVHSIGYYFKDENEELKSRYVSHRGVNCIDLFMSDLTNIAIEVFDFLECKRPMNALTTEEEENFRVATICHICKKAFKFESKSDSADDESDIHVRDHCHISGQYRGAAHQSCNLQYQISRIIPIVMHNLSGYDSHFLIRKLANIKEIPGEIKILPHNSEKYISFIKTMRGVGFRDEQRRYIEIKFQFIDSLRFMSASLDYLASVLPHDKKNILKSECAKSGYSDDMFNLLIRKGVFPYEYIDCYEKLTESMLPPQKSFHSMLTQSNVTDDDYEHAQRVWKEFGIQTLAEYSDLYLKTDVLLLADVFESFRSTCHAAYSLDPAHYFGAPGLSFDAMLKRTKVSIELLTDVDMLMFAERGIRGGVSQINKRYVKANNIHMGAEFDASKESSYLLYLDGKKMFVSFAI